MDHKQSYALHIAAAIRAKKAMGGELGNAAEPEELHLDSLEDLEPEAPIDPKAARKERVRQILSR